MNLKQLQQEQAEWSRHNFGAGGDPIHPVLGVVEEVGELAHAILKGAQGIRGTKEEHEAAAQDAVADITIFLSDVCTRRGWDYDAIVERVWGQVKQRDWTKDKQSGGAA